MLSTGAAVVVMLWLNNYAPIIMEISIKVHGYAFYSVYVAQDGYPYRREVQPWSSV